MFNLKLGLKSIPLFLLALLLAACSDDSNQETVKPAPVQANQSAEDDIQAAKGDTLTGFSVLSAFEGLYDKSPALVVHFSLPLSQEQDINQLLQLLSEQSQLVKGGWILSDNRRSAYFPSIEAQKNYRLEVLNPLQAVNGKSLNRNFVKKISTKPARQMVRFTSNGSTLLPDSAVLPIEAVNVKEVDLNFWKIKNSALESFVRYGVDDYSYQLNRLQNQADLVHSGRFSLKHKANQLADHNINLNDIDALKHSGVYIVTMKSSLAYPDKYQVNWFSISDIGLHTKHYPNSMALFANKLSDSKSYSGVQIKLLDDEGRELIKKQTDGSGFASFLGNELNQARLLIAQKGDNLTVLHLQKNRLDLSDYSLPSRKQYQQELFLYSSRDIYRPGEKVNISAVLRDFDGKKITASPIRVEVIQPDDRVFRSFIWQGDADAFYHQEFQIPSTSITGRWNFKATLGNKDRFSYEFSVEDFLPERLSLDVKPQSDQENITIFEDAFVEIQADYLYGAPAANNKFDARVSLKTATSLFDDYKGFVFGSNHYQDFNQTFDIEAQQLDSDGHAQLEIENQWAQAGFPLKLTTHVNVYESGGRPITRKTKQVIWPRQHAIGIRPSWTAEYASPNANTEFEFVAVDQEGQRQSLENLNLVLIRENRQAYWSWRSSGWGYNQSERNVAVYSKSFSIKDDVNTRLSLPLEYGYYRVELREDGDLQASYRFFAGWQWDDPEAAQRPDKIELKWNQDSFKANEQATLKIKSPYKGTALITIESDKLLWNTTVAMDSEESELIIPIDESWQHHNIYATAMVVKGADVKRKNLPNRALGILHLPLNREDRQLDVAIEHPQKLEPEQEFELEVRLDKLMSGEKPFVTVSLVDAGVLSVTNFKSPDPYRWFFKPRKFLTDLRDMYNSIIEFGSGHIAKQRFGGDEDLTRGGDAPLSDVQIVSIFSGKVEVNEQGKAQIPVKLPYFNGELRIMAQAFSAHQMGSSASKVKVAAPIVIQASMPRFMAKGDQSFATVDIQNMEAKDKSLTIELSSDGALGGTKSNLQLELAANAKHTLQLPIKAALHKGMGHVYLKLSEGDSANSKVINRDWSLGLRPAFPAVFKQQTAVLAKDESFTFAPEFVAMFDNDGLKNALTLSNMPPLQAQNHLSNLLQYPYGCLEQTSSRAWPLLLANQNDFAEFSKTNNSNLWNDKKQNIDKAISRILGMQRYDGSFGLWSNESPENTWLSVYASEFLLGAKQLGYAFSEDALESALKKLSYYVRNNTNINTEIFNYSENPAHYTLAYRAYAAFVLAKVNKTNLQQVRYLYDNYHQSAQSSVPYAHMASALEMLGDERRAKEAWSKASHFKYDDSRYWYYGDYGSTVRDLSLTLLLAEQSKLAKIDSEQLFKLAALLKSRRWLSTQEQLSIFRLAKALENRKGEEFSFLFNYLNKDTSLQQSQDFIKVIRGEQAKSSFSLKNQSEKDLYLDLKIQGYPEKGVEADMQNIAILREFYDVSGKAVDLQNVTSGDLVLVHLQLSLTKDYATLPDAMLVDLLPAGFELENQNLEHSMKLDELMIKGKSVESLSEHNEINHEEYRDDRFVAALSLSSYRASNAFYLVRAVTPGEYTIPPTLVEDMYRPEIRSIGITPKKLRIKAKEVQ